MSLCVFHLRKADQERIKCVGCLAFEALVDVVLSATHAPGCERNRVIEIGAGREPMCGCHISRAKAALEKLETVT